MERSCCLDNNLSAIRGELKNLEEHHKRLQEEYRELVKSIRKAHSLTLAKDS